MRQTKKGRMLAEKTWARYTSALVQGHSKFQRRASKNEDYYLGAGRQWDDQTKAELEAQGRPWLESNLIFSVINTVTGYQTQTRLDIAYKPRETGDQDLADILSKIGMHVLDQNEYPWIESQAFSDGMIQSRGYLDIRMDFTENMFGNVKIVNKDPLDIIPDPDAKTYDPDDWADVIETVWMTVDDIEEQYGKRLASVVSKYNPYDQDFGVGELGSERNKFSGKDGEETTSWMADDAGIPHVRVIERQYWKMELREFFMDNGTGDIIPVPDDLSAKEKNERARMTGQTIIKKLVKRVRWTVCTKDVILHDEWSPYDHFTIVPYFPYFRRGVTIGLVDNLTSTQDMFNKTLSQTLHIVNTTANSGWIVDENSLSNMDTEDLEEIGASTGIVIETKAGRERPEKIKHNEVPTGLDNLANKSAQLISSISGVSEIFQGQKGPEVTGVAIQSRVQQNAVQLAAPLDNLYRTRHMLAKRILELIQNFYTEERMFTVTVTDKETGEEQEQQVKINEYQDEINGYLNDTTQGKYDVVISDVPDQVTFQNSQFAQAIEMRKFGIEIPDDVLVMLSGLSNKSDIAKRMQGAADPEAQQRAAQMQELELAEKQAAIESEKADQEAKRTKAQKDAIDAAIALMESPEATPAATELQRQAGMAGAQPGNEAQPQQQGVPFQGNQGQQMTPEEQMMLQEQMIREGQV